ncbi:homeobox-domain-containing protein [Epithele typhae]|uniref:homeobox-domain-containing protein n=1 Tax=Epithele typhae TaxID=378194 RepID=UPI0020078E5F|nr:homeobox-domain-containing protein [Epithele typhae]KAH9931118.1 homeobox-domain-containing protein [Epithele typhae]
MAHHHSPDDHFSQGCFPRQSRRGTPTGTNSTSNSNSNSNSNSRFALFRHQSGGRTLLPNLFGRSSHSPAPDPSSSQFLQQDPTQSFHDPSLLAYGQQGWQANQGKEVFFLTCWHTLNGVLRALFPASRTRPPGCAFFWARSPIQAHALGSYPLRASPNSIGTPHDSRILPPPNALQSQMQSHLSMSPSQLRTTPGAYQYPQYPQQQHQQQLYYPSGPDPRHLPPPLPPMDAYEQHHPHGQRRNSLVDRMPNRIGPHGPSPYQRSMPAMTPEPPAEPIKKKRKRADPEQLKVLNETYNRTAFPSTEERMELAQKLGMSARSVQIWFQNKRQAVRQSTRQAASSAPPTTSAPQASPSHGSASPVATIPQAGYSSHTPSTVTSPSISQAGYGASRPTSGMGGSSAAAGRSMASQPSSSHRRSHDGDAYRQDYRFSPRPGQY